MAKNLFLSILLGMLASALKSFGIPAGFEIKTYSQTLDHFNYGPKSSTTFPQRYAINSMHWGGASTNSPIFCYLGDESALDGDLMAGLIIENAPRFKALLVFVEHRYYGQSFPFGSKKEAFRNSTTLQHLNSEQALADYAQFLRDLKNDMSAENCPVIAVGGSYGGMLAAWFRLKYPHMVIGALASSAPILSFDNLTPQDAYYLTITKVYKETSEHCVETIKNSWSEIDEIANQVNGLATLSQMFNACRPLNSTNELKSYLEEFYVYRAQYNTPGMKKLCDKIDREAQSNNSALQKLVSALKSPMYCKNFELNAAYYIKAWNWQALGKNTMFDAPPFDINNFTLRCAQLFADDVPIRPRWITTEYGGQNIKKVLGNFGSNIIFSNGLRDPYSSAGVLQNISDSIVALVTEEGSCSSDLWGSHDLWGAYDSNPDWLISQRKAELEIFQKWIEEYNAKQNLR